LWLEIHSLTQRRGCIALWVSHNYSRKVIKIA
jgi:hypothetical protein